MAERISVFTVADLHRDKGLYEQLATVVNRHQPDILACVGDFLDKSPNNHGKLDPVEAAHLLRGLPVSETLFIRGNHEDSAARHAFEVAWKESRPEFHLLDRAAFVYGPLVIVGFPCLMDAMGRTGDDAGNWLSEVIESHGDAGRVLWLMHEPPYRTELSQQDGPYSGNQEWSDAIRRHSPWLAVFGQDHTTPHKKKCWYQTLGNQTVCVNVEQDAKLHYTFLEFTFASSTPSAPSQVKVTAHPKGERLQLPLR